MCLIQDVPTLGRHPVKRVHAAVPSAAEDDFPCLRDKSARSCLRPSADGLSEPLDADHAPAMFWVAPARPSACAALALRTLPPRSARLAGVAARKQERYVLMLMTKRLNGLSRFGKLSGIRDIPYPGRAASVRRGAGSGDGIRHLRHTAIPGARAEKAPEHLRATGLQTAPAWHRINARAGHPVTGRAWPCHACASRRILPRGLPGPARQRAPAAFPARQQPPGCR